MAKRCSKGKRIIEVKKLVDMSGREQVWVETNEDYNEDDLKKMLVKMNKQRELVKGEFYSSNVLIERIAKRRFRDILQRKKQHIIQELKEKIANSNSLCVMGNFRR